MGGGLFYSSDTPLREEKTAFLNSDVEGIRRGWQVFEDLRQQVSNESEKDVMQFGSQSLTELLTESLRAGQFTSQVFEHHT